MINIKSQWIQLSKVEQEEKLNKIDKEATELLISTEKECCHLRVEAVSFSPELLKARLRQRFWTKFIYFRNRQFKDSQYIISMVQYLGIQDPWNFTYIQCINKLKEAKSNYKEIKSSSIEMREKYISNNQKIQIQKMPFFWT